MVKSREKIQIKCVDLEGNALPCHATLAFWSKAG